MVNGAPVGEVIRYHHLRTCIMKEGIDGNEDDDYGVFVGETSPFEDMICSKKEGGGQV